MMTSTFVWCVLLALAVFAACSPVSAAPSPDVQSVSAAGSDFGFRVLHRLAADKPSGNVFFSPFSISQALTLTMSGAGGQTQINMAKTLGLEALPQDKINAANAELLPALTSDPDVQIAVANALWADRGVQFSPAFLADAKRYYNAQATTLDFSSPSAAGTINGWASRNTQGRIPEIVTADDLFAAQTVLTNAVYFHGKWQKPFDKADTELEPFYLTGGGTKTMPLMTQTNDFPYLDTPQFQAASLPYGTGRILLSVLLPKPGVSADALAHEITAQTMSGWLGAMQATELHLFLPRFKADDRIEMQKPLSAVGMALAFSNAADFTRMGPDGIKLGEVVHQATVDVDELGTTAAAVTGAGGMAGSTTTPQPPPPPIPIMRVDRPFLLLIRDTETGSLLFVGVIRDPQ